MIKQFETENAEDGTTLHGVIYTPDNPVAVLNLVHGFGEHSGRYLHMMDALGQHGIAVAAIDLRGHGKSEGKRGVCHKYDLMHGDVKALFAQSKSEFPELPQFLFGHSMGGGLVLNHILSHGHAGLSGIIASAPLIALTDPPSGFLNWLIRILRKVAPNLAIKNKIDGTKVSTIPAEQKAYENDPLNHGSLGVGLAVDMVDGGQWIASQAPQWTAPLLLMHAKNDQLTSFAGSESFSKAAANCTFRAYPDSEHEIHNDVSRDDVYREIISFIEARL